MKSSERSINLWSSRKDVFVGRPNTSGASLPKCITDLNHAVEADSICEVLGFSGDEEVLDIGAGGGRWTLEFSTKVGHITAIEPSDIYDILLENVKKIPNVSCINTSFEDYSEHKQFDLIIVSGVLFYIIEDSEIDKFISKVSGLLRKDGTLVMRESVASRGRTIINWEMHPVNTEINFSTCQYWEKLRPGSFYIDKCKQYNMHLTGSFSTHAPFFQYFPSILLFAKPTLEPLINKFFRPANLNMILKYNKLFRGLYKLIQDLLSSKAYRFFIYRKS